MKEKTLSEALDEAGLVGTKHYLSFEQQAEWNGIEQEFEKWWMVVHPEYCECGNKIEEHDCGINGIDVCKECMHEATKHMLFK